MTAAGGRALVLPADVSQFDQVDAAAARAENELGPIDVWVNDAMTTVFAPTWDIKPEDFQRAVEVTFLGQVWDESGAGPDAAAGQRHDRQRRLGPGHHRHPAAGRLLLGEVRLPGFFESTRAELLHEGSHVRMSMVYLPAVNTPQFDWCKTTMDRHPQPVPPIYQPELIAKFILEAALTGRREKVIGSWNKLLVMAGRCSPAWATSTPRWGPGPASSPASRVPRSPGQPVPPGRRQTPTTAPTASSTTWPAASWTRRTSGPCPPRRKPSCSALTRDLRRHRRRVTLPPRPRPAVPLTQRQRRGGLSAGVTVGPFGPLRQDDVICNYCKLQT